MSYIEFCNKKDRLPGSFSRQIRLKNEKVGSTAMEMRYKKILGFSNLNVHTLFITS